MLRRVRQFTRALSAVVSPAEIEGLRETLSPAQIELFLRMQRSDQRHSLDVYGTLRGAGYDDPDLLQAALLHDVGKAAARLTVWHRVAFVLLKRFLPDWLARLADDGRGWKAPFAAYARHAERSADWAAQAGSRPQVVACIRNHHRADGLDRCAAALQWADAQH